MPSLFRFLLVVALLAGLVYGAMLALVTFVQVTPRPMEQEIPSARLNK
ncbi:MAG TPA: histidine kinase [Lichenihabitans sp.]|nr:histidine kinase [Lichenihabitans sp.]